MIDDLIDKKIFALLDYVGYEFDEEDENDVLMYFEMRDFAEKNDGLLFHYNDDDYIIIHFTDGDFLIAQVDYNI